MTPPAPELAAAIAALQRDLTELKLLHVFEQDDLNTDVYTAAAYDSDGYVNSGLIVWADDKMHYWAHDPMRENHDTAEGINPDESMCWWSAGSREVFLAHLCGEARRIVAKYRKIALEHDDENELDNAN